MRRWLFVSVLGCAGPAQKDASVPQHTPDSGDTAQDTGADVAFGPVSIDPNAKPPTLLSQTQLLRWNGVSFEHNKGVIPYDVATPLFSDMALKHRTIWVPEGQTIQYTDQGVFDFPVGTVITKSFLFPADLRHPTDGLRLIETRLLIRGQDEWAAWPYIWDEAGTDAVLDVTGEVLEISLVDLNGTAQISNYLIPQRNQCVECHEVRQTDGSREMTLIGPKARWLNRTFDYGEGPVNQLSAMAEWGILSGLPELSEVPTATDFFSVAAQVRAEGVASLSSTARDEAARDYLDANCAHCHNEGAVEGVSSQLWLNHDATDMFHLGVCKRPSSAGEGTGGLDYDIVPGAHAQSILWYRTATTDVGAMMPQIGRSLSDEVGAVLIASWIDNLPSADCSE